jgi:beta-1,4-mannosyltransferase
MNHKIIMMPDYRLGAHYQSPLVKALNQEGFKIMFPDKISIFPLWFPIFRSVLTSKTKNLHMHWIDRFSGFRSKNLLVSLLKSFLFIFDIFLTKSILKAKIIWTVHNKYTHECVHIQVERIIRKFFSYKVDAVICHCNQAKKEIQSEFGTPQNKIYVIPIGNYINGYKNEISKEKALINLKLKNEDFIFLSFGAIRPYKGIDNLIKCFKTLGKDKNVKLLIIGKPVNDQIKTDIIESSKASDNIKLQFEYIPDNAIQIFFNASTIVVFSFQKILGSAGILLAMSFGKPIIAPRLGCITDILDEKGAFLYNPRGNKSLAIALKNAIENKDKFEEMGLYNLKLARLYEWKKIGIETKKVYDKFFN